MNHKDFLLQLISPTAQQGGGGGTPAVLIDKNISANGTYNASDDNADGYKKAVVNVQTDLQAKSVTITENGSSSVTPDQGKDGLSGVAITVNVPTSGSPNDFIDQYVERTLTGVLSSAQVDSIGDYGLYKQAGITGVNFPNCTVVGERAFYGCSGLLALHLPECTNLKTYNLWGCTSLKEIILEKCTTIGVTQFDTNAQLPVESVILPLLKTMNWGTGNFRYLAQLDVPKLESMANNNIKASSTSYKNTALRAVELPSIKTMGTGNFQNFQGLQGVKFGPNLTSIGNSSFAYTTELRTVIFDEDTAAVPTLGGTSAFGTSSIRRYYVPDALLTDWKSASVWATYADYIKGLSEIPDWVSGDTFQQYRVAKRSGAYYICQGTNITSDPAEDPVNWLYVGAV